MDWISDFPIPAQVGIFGLLDRQALHELNRLPERNRFLPGLRAWVGFDQRTVEYDRQERAAGTPKQTLWRLTRYAMDGFLSFSYKPLRLMIGAGVTVSLIGFGLAFSFIVRRLIGTEIAPTGFTTLVTLLLVLGGLQLLAMGLLGEYLGRIYEEVKQRPLYIVKRHYRDRNIVRGEVEWQRKLSHRMRHPPHKRRLGVYAAVAAMLAWYFASSISAVATKSVTFDEMFHLTGGYSYWKFGDFRLHPENGNLPQRWAAIPLFFGRHDTFPILLRMSGGCRTCRPLANSFLYGIGNDADGMLTARPCDDRIVGRGVGVADFSFGTKPAGDWAGAGEPRALCVLPVGIGARADLSRPTWPRRCFLPRPCCASGGCCTSSIGRTCWWVRS